MDLTIFLSQIWGPILLSVGVGFFLSRSFYMLVYRDLEKGPFAVIFFGMVAMAAGLTQVLAHSVWGNLTQIIISALGWGLLLKGIICTAWPRLADRGAEWALVSKVMPAAGVVCLAIGAYLTWVGYLG